MKIGRILGLVAMAACLYMFFVTISDFSSDNINPLRESISTSVKDAVPVEILRVDSITEDSTLATGYGVEASW